MSVHITRLKEARDKLAQHNGWARGPGNGKDCWCIITSLDYRTTYTTIEYIRDAIKELHPEFCKSYLARGYTPSIVDWNDGAAKDVDEVLAVMDLAIEKAAKNLSDPIEQEA